MSGISIAVEAWRDALAELMVLWPAHWMEVALDHDSVPLDPDLDAYNALDEAGKLHLVVVRSAGRIVGYHISFVSSHAHYRSTLFAQTDVYYIDPAHRKGMTGVLLFKEVERTLAQRGVTKMVAGTKLQNSTVTGESLDISVIFERLGWRETERTYTKCIGGQS